MTLEDIKDVQMFPWRDDVSSNKWWARDLKLGEIACSLTHDNMWRLFLESKQAWAVFVEDDAVLKVSASELASRVRSLSAALEAWDFIYLDRRRWGEDISSDELPMEFVFPGFSACLHAYVLSRNGARTLVNLGIRQRMMPVDDFVPAAMGVHPRMDVARSVPPLLSGRAVAFRERQAEVLPRDVWGSGTEESPFLPDWLTSEATGAASSAQSKVGQINFSVTGP